MGEQKHILDQICENPRNHTLPKNLISWIYDEDKGSIMVIKAKEGRGVDWGKTLDIVVNQSLAEIPRINIFTCPSANISRKTLPPPTLLSIIHSQQYEHPNQGVNAYL